jgi:hypothetical protein
LSRQLKRDKASEFVLAELQFLVDSLLKDSEEMPPPRDVLADVMGKPEIKIETLLSGLWQALLYAGSRLSQGHYQEAISALRIFVPFVKDLPAAYRLRLTIILGICFQATGRFADCAEQLQHQKDVLDVFPSVVLSFALSRRQLSYAIETENLFSAKEIALHMERLSASVRSQFLLTLYYQEKIKLSILMGDGFGIDALQVQQESVIENSKIPVHFVVPIEERCEAAIQAKKPQKALKIVAKQAWLSREHGMLNGQLIAAMILLQCQMQLGRVQAARITLNEIRYLCQTYSFGRDEVRARILESIWILQFGQRAEGMRILLSAQYKSLSLGLRIHSWALRIFQFVLEPSREGLFQAFPAGRHSARDLRSSLALLRKWVGLMKMRDSEGSDLFERFSLLDIQLSQSRPYIVSSIGYPDFGIWLIVTFFDEDDVSLETASFVSGGQYDLWLRRLLSSSDPVGLADLHALAFPRTPYSPSRHRSRVLLGLQKMRAALRGDFVHYRQVTKGDGGHFGLGIRDMCKLVPEPVIWTAAASPAQRSASVRLQRDSEAQASEPVGSKRRGNSPQVAATIASKCDRIVQWLKAHGPSSGSEMATGMGLARKSLHFYLKHLVDLSVISLSGLGRSARYSLKS